MRLTIHLFAAAKQRAGASRWELELPDSATVAVVKAELGRVCPDLAPLLGSSRMAVNGEYATDDQSLTESDELAVIPPVSGGSTGPGQIGAKSW